MRRLAGKAGRVACPDGDGGEIVNGLGAADAAVPGVEQAVVDRLGQEQDGGDGRDGHGQAGEAVPGIGDQQHRQRDGGEGRIGAKQRGISEAEDRDEKRRHRKRPVAQAVCADDAGGEGQRADCLTVLDHDGEPAEQQGIGADQEQGDGLAAAECLGKQAKAQPIGDDLEDEQGAVPGPEKDRSDQRRAMTGGCQSS